MFPVFVPTSPGLSISILQEEDTEELYHLIDANRAYLRKFLSWVDLTNSTEALKDFILSSLEAFRKREQAAFGLRLDGELIGSMGLIWNSETSAQIGYWIAKQHQGKGLVTAATKALMEALHQELKVSHFEILSAKENDRSKSIAIRLGFHKIASKRKSSFYLGSFVPSEVYVFSYDH